MLSDKLDDNLTISDKSRSSVTYTQKAYCDLQLQGGQIVIEYNKNY